MLVGGLAEATPITDISETVAASSADHGRELTPLGLLGRKDSTKSNRERDFHNTITSEARTLYGYPRNLESHLISTLFLTFNTLNSQ